MTAPIILDLFAGPGGFDTGARAIGLHPIGLEIDDAAVATRYAAGHATWQQSVPDVTDTQLERLRGRVDGLIASPPCQDFSAAGKKAGITGDKGELMWQVPRWAKALRPRWIACEQVPPAEAWFRLFAHDLRADGYSTWVGVLCAADYGVPQTRRRVFLLASLDRAVQPPEPTHCEGGSEPSMFTPGLLPWVSMAEALGWGGGGESWPWTSPATTIAGDPRITARCHHDEGSQGANPRTTAQVRAGDYDGTEPIKVTITEAATLQGFPPDYPWQGSRTKQFEQIGNACAPPLMIAVLGAATGIEWSSTHLAYLTKLRSYEQHLQDSQDRRADAQ